VLNTKISVISFSAVLISLFRSRHLYELHSVVVDRKGLSPYIPGLRICEGEYNLTFTTRQAISGLRKEIFNFRFMVPYIVVIT